MNSTEIIYRDDRRISSAEFVDVLRRSTLDERRPVQDQERINKMLEYGNILITAWAGEKLVGVSRALTDFSFCCYLSDLAVDEAFQKRGIGKKLIDETHRVAGDQTQLILLAAPKAIHYYPKIGLQQFPHCFVIPRKSKQP